MVLTIVQLFNLVVQQACCPKDWRRSYIVQLYKVSAKLLSRRLGTFAEEEILTERSRILSFITMLVGE